MLWKYFIKYQDVIVTFPSCSTVYKGKKSLLVIAKKNADKTTFFNNGSVPFSVSVNSDDEPADAVASN